MHCYVSITAVVTRTRLAYLVLMLNLNIIGKKVFTRKLSMQIRFGFEETWQISRPTVTYFVGCVCPVNAVCYWHWPLPAMAQARLAGNTLFWDSAVCCPQIHLNWENVLEHFTGKPRKLLFELLRNKKRGSTPILLAASQHKRGSTPILLAASQHKRMAHASCCIYSKVLTDDEQWACSKHVEVNYWNKLRVKQCILFVLIARIYHHARFTKH